MSSILKESWDPERRPQVQADGWLPLSCPSTQHPAHTAHGWCSPSTDSFTIGPNWTSSKTGRVSRSTHEKAHDRVWLDQGPGGAHTQEGGGNTFPGGQGWEVHTPTGAHLVPSITAWLSSSARGAAWPRQLGASLLTSGGAACHEPGARLEGPMGEVRRGSDFPPGELPFPEDLSPCPLSPGQNRIYGARKQRQASNQEQASTQRQGA